jgi:hypothetical protein
MRKKQYNYYRDQLLSFEEGVEGILWDKKILVNLFEVAFRKKTSLNQALVVSIMDKFLLIMEHMQIKQNICI